MAKITNCEARMYVIFLGLKEDVKKEYSDVLCEHNVAYIFNNYEEFKAYFVNNGFESVDDDLLNICKMKVASNGAIVALKGLCDHAIREHRKENCKKYLKNMN